MNFRIATLALAGLFVASAANAADKLDCNGIGYEAGMGNLALGAITGGKTYFVANQSDKPKCPSTDASCKRRGYGLAGDQVVVDTDGGTKGYVCVAFIGAKGVESDGWMPQANVKITPAVVNWVGTWKRDTTSEIDITKKSATTAEVSGTATYGEEERQHDGEIDAVIDSRASFQSFATSGDNQIAFSKAGQDDCAVEMRQLGNYLYVNDNENCGGANVTFSGLYAKH
ncbi:MAG TPA: hypothetical protein VH000_07980 [Rhizomicrobium sp.]|jgi:hypothetical protein|nr:hypothetical protein [Rhizomicrobium sp.]